MTARKLKLMKHKSMICLVLTFLIAFSLFSVTTHFINAASVAVLSIVPTGQAGATAGTITNIPAQAVGTTFSVDVRVDNYASVNIGGKDNGVSGASYEVFWNPAVLEYISKTPDVSWLPDQSSSGDILNYVAYGNLTIGQIAFNTANPFTTADSSTGSVSATIKFQVLSSGSSPITLQPQKGVAYLVAPQTNDEGETFSRAVSGTETANAQYGPSSSSPPSVFGPTAIFTPTDGSTFKLGSSITLDASLSQPGYDTQACNITSYVWSVEFLNGTTFTSLTGEAPTFTATVDGTFQVILIVTANDVAAAPSPSYESTGSSSDFIAVVSNLQSVAIDVFTDKGGVGQGVSSGAYGPLQQVQTYALVTYKNTPMPNENVLFSILDANGTYYCRQGVTNDTGIAAIQPSFRLPAPDFGSPQTSFGTWSITAAVNVLGVTVNDTTKFTFTYLNGIENVTIPATANRNETLPIQLTINNQELSTQWTQLSITLFDQAGIPIGSSTITATQQTQSLTVIDASINIPSWAFPGQATAYLCLLSNSTDVPLAPESTANFTILS